MEGLRLIPLIKPGVISRMIEPGDKTEREALILLPEQGQVKVINEVGAVIWSLVDGQRDVAQIASLIHQEYQVQLEHAQADVLEFLRDLESREVIYLRAPHA